MDNEQHIVVVLDDHQHQITLFQSDALVEPDDPVLPVKSFPFDPITFVWTLQKFYDKIGQKNS
jgi:hypothetical protein